MTTRGSLELAAWVAARDAVIIEDGYDAGFRYDRDPVGALQGITAKRKRRADRGSPVPPQLVLGFGNTGERAILAAIAAVGDVLTARARR
jgi:hypothetical protein